MTVADLRPVVDWFIQLIETGTDRPVGDMVVPKVSDDDDLGAHCIVYLIPGGGFSGPILSAPDADVSLILQVTSVGKQRRQAQWMADLVRRVVLARTSSGAFQVQLDSPVGWAVIDRRPVGGPGGVDLGGKPPHYVFSQADRFEIYVTPG